MASRRGAVLFKPSLSPSPPPSSPASSSSLSLHSCSSLDNRLECILSWSPQRIAASHFHVKRVRTSKPTAISSSSPRFSSFSHTSSGCCSLPHLRCMYTSPRLDKKPAHVRSTSSYSSVSSPVGTQSSTAVMPYTRGEERKLTNLLGKPFLQQMDSHARNSSFLSQSSFSSLPEVSPSPQAFYSSSSVPSTLRRWSEEEEKKRKKNKRDSFFSTPSSSSFSSSSSCTSSPVPCNKLSLLSSPSSFKISQSSSPLHNSPRSSFSSALLFSFPLSSLVVSSSCSSPSFFFFFFYSCLIALRNL